MRLTARCYGRWDTPQHILTDEDFTESSGPNGPIWRGKDYANERVAEYSNLDKPFEDFFERGKVPRMPWHDVGLQIVGQPARDLCRHFVQRWNLLIRTKVSAVGIASSTPLLSLRTTRGRCRSYSPHRTLRTANCTTSSSKARVRCRSVDPSALGRWVL
jgi:phosphatidylserine/phosphatidylglycerophosphate/cardiolipin synthase-like enzyme